MTTTKHESHPSAPIESTESSPAAPPTKERAKERALRRASLGLVAAFVLGAVSGGSGHQAYLAHAGEVRDWYVDLREPSGPWSDGAASVPVTSEDPSWGARAALVTIVQFSDFQCPFCSRVESTMSKIRSAYGAGDVRIVWKSNPLPFHDNAKPTAEAAQGVYELAGRRAFWKFHDLAFQHQSELTAANFEAWAKVAGVKDRDIPAFKDGLAKHAYASKVEADLAEGAKVGVGGTPAAYINGVLVSGAQPYAAFKKVIDEQLVKAKAALAAGTRADGLYVAVSQENAKNAPPASADADEPKADSKTVHAVPLGNAPALGRGDAPVTIVAFSDFQCPFCKRGEDTIQHVRETYGDKVRVVWRDAPLPFHDRALPAANLAREARAEKGDAAFWQAHDAIFASAPALDDADLARIGASLKLDPKKVAAAIATNGYEKGIDEDKALGEGLKVNGTPAFFINGRSLVGAQPFEAFKAIIDEEIPKGDALKAKGVKDVYETLTGSKDVKAPPKS